MSSQTLTLINELTAAASLMSELSTIAAIESDIALEALASL